MAPSASDIARLRRMVNEPDAAATYSDELLAAYLLAWPTIDRNGKTYEDGDAWIEGYDLHAAAADVWDEKAATLSVKHDFSADGASFSSNQMYENAIEQSRHHRALQRAKVKRAIPITRATYYPSYANPIFDEDEPPDFVDTII